jgi:excisionase family DNA binding protein
MVSSRKTPKKSSAPSSVDRSLILAPTFEPILTAEQVSEILQLKPSTIYELTRRRNARPLPAHKAGKFLRFRRSEIECWLDGKAA